jgi:hypothetical protein
LWFYPTANNKIIIGELGQTTENSDWHLSMLEIDSSNKLKGRVWELISGSYPTSTGSVNLNAWNHVYFYYNHATNTFGMSLNNETAVTQTGFTRHTSDTNFTYWGIGLTDSQNMGSSDRYQGKFDALVIDTTITGSNFEATKAKYNQVTLTSGTALAFNGTDNRHVIVADNVTDWNLGDNWTIEWWHKIPVGASGFLSILCQDANVPTYSGIDVFVNAGNIQMFNGNRQMSEGPATRDQWNHIALQNNGGTLAGYINGIAQSFNGPHNGTIAPSSPLNVAIGSRTYDGGVNFYGQYFNGLLANIRISNVARFSTIFTPPTTVVVDANTKLALSGQVGGSGMLDDVSASNHTITNNGAVVTPIGTLASPYSVRQWLNGYDPGVSNSNLYVLVADYPYVSLIPVGASVTVNGTPTTVSNVSAVQTVYGQPVIQINFTGGTPGSTIGAGDTLTFSW